jgi:hypothetical protein
MGLETLQLRGHSRILTADLMFSMLTIGNTADMNKYRT